MISTMSPVEQNIYKKKIADKSGVDERALDSELVLKSREKPREKRIRPETSDKASAQITLSPLEKSLLRLIMTDASYGARIKVQMVGKRSTLLNRVIGLAENYADRPESVWEEALFDTNQEYTDLLIDIRDNINLDPDTEKVFRQCMRDAQLQDLKEKESQIRRILAMTDEEDPEASQELMERLKIIQSKRQLLQSEEGGEQE
jgi:hypothetical protein